MCTDLGMQYFVGWSYIQCAALYLRFSPGLLTNNLTAGIDGIACTKVSHWEPSFLPCEQEVELSLFPLVFWQHAFGDVRLPPCTPHSHQILTRLVVSDRNIWLTSIIVRLRSSLSWWIPLMATQSLLVVGEFGLSLSIRHPEFFWHRSCFRKHPRFISVTYPLLCCSPEKLHQHIRSLRECPLHLLEV